MLYWFKNYTGGTNGVTIRFGGTAVIGPQANFTTSISGCNVTITNLFPAIPNYSYSWDFGDNTSSNFFGSNFCENIFGRGNIYYCFDGC